jgi:hypothetical protein
MQLNWLLELVTLESFLSFVATVGRVSCATTSRTCVRWSCTIVHFKATPFFSVSG